MENNLLILEEAKPTLTQLILANMESGSSIEDAERVVLREIANFEMIVSLKPELLNCDKQSILLAVKQCISDNLTLSQSDGLVYLYPTNVKVGMNSANQPIYKNVLVYEPTAEGRISIARQAGSILDHKRPVFTYDANGMVDTVTFEFLVPSYNEPRWEKIVFDKNNFAKWKQKSAAKFGGNANANYTSWNGGIDPEFAGSKAIKHSLKKLGTNKNENRKQVIQPQIQSQSKTLKIEHIPVQSMPLIEEAKEENSSSNEMPNAEDL